MKTENQEERTYRYLLGDLTEGEQISFEQQVFSDQDSFEQVWEIENRLVDSYVRGSLDDRERDLFERNYLASSVHRERVAFARNLVAIADSTTSSGAVTSNADSSIPRLASFPGSRRKNNWGQTLRWAMIAAMLVLALGAVTQWTERSRLQKEIASLSDQSSSEKLRTDELEKEVATQREKSDELEAEIHNLREASRNLEQPSQSPTGQGDLHQVVSFLLSPLLVRGSGNTQQVKITPENTTLILQMKVHNAGTKKFQVALRTVEGTPVSSKAAIRSSKQTPNGAMVSAAFPAGKLAAGDYILTLSATSDTNEVEELNRYFFRIVKQ